MVQKAQENGGHIDKDLLIEQLGWSEERATKAINDLIADGLVWIDQQTGTGTTWLWFPGLV